MYNEDGLKWFLCLKDSSNRTIKHTGNGCGTIGCIILLEDSVRRIAYILYVI